MNEDFAPFELAVKLKEKGFDRPCIYAYCEQGGWNKYKQVHEPIIHVLRTDGNPFGSFYCGKNWNVKYETNKNKIRCSAPTISQVLKWLREEKKIYIVIAVNPTLSTKDKIAYYYQVYSNSNGETSDYYESEECYAQWEDCAIGSIKSVLKYLI